MFFLYSMEEIDDFQDLGHTQTIGAILGRLPKQRRTGLFSATEADGVTALCRAGLRNQIKIKIEIKNNDRVQMVPALLKNYYLTLPSDAKFGFVCLIGYVDIQLVRFLQAHQQQKIIIFYLTCASVDYFAAALQTVACLKSRRILSLHGRMVQKRRTRTMNEFRQPNRINVPKLSSLASVLICTDVAARCIDVPDIDWIIQYTPPQDPAFFVHRVGRTARAGKHGESVLLVEPSESAYIPFTKKRGVPLSVLKEESLRLNEEEEACVENDMLSERVREESLSYLKVLRETCSTDRDFYEKSVTAFVADIRVIVCFVGEEQAYRNHDCNFILRFEDLDLASLARSFALVRLPKMSELRSRNVDYEALPVDVASIPYRDPVREQARQERLKKEMKEREKKAENQQKRERKSVKRDMKEEEKKKKKGKHEKIMDEWDELQEEERLYRLFKKNKLRLK